MVRHMHGSISGTEMDDLVRNRIPLNTCRSTGWSISTWNSWALEKNSTSTQKAKIPFVDKLLNFKVSCNWMCRFVCEVRTKAGEEYSSIHLNNLFMVSIGNLKTSKLI